MLTEATINKALAPFTAGFESDGVKMELDKIEEAAVTIKLIASAEACRDCIMPVPHLQQMFQQALKSEGMPGIDVRVTIVDEAA